LVGWKREEMADTRKKQAKLNILVTLLCQIITLLCGLIVPKLIIDAFGSEAYGATTSIAQFLAYISLLEGGVGGVARAALYKPLSENDVSGISLVVSETKRFFRIIAYIFVAYVAVLACGYKYISGIQCFDWISTVFLVLVISISTFVQYFVGISYSLLLQAAQKTYIINAVTLVATALNAVFVVVLVNCGCSLIAVKLVSSLVFAVRPLVMWFYVKRTFALVNSKKRDATVLQQKWTGLGQHIAFFLHSNTDVVVLTVFADLKLVAVYSVHNMIVAQIQNITTSFSAGMEALFGNMLAKKEFEQLHRWFGYYETLLSIVASILFSTTAIMVTPFVRLYTVSAADVNYIQPVFAIILILSTAVHCLRMPYHSMTIAAGHFKQTRAAAYGEAGINIILSIALVSAYGLTGVAVATLAATAFRLIYYVVYLSRNIICRKLKFFLKRMFVNAGVFILICTVGAKILSCWRINDYMQWCILGIAVISISTILTLLLNILFYWNDVTMLWNALQKKMVDHARHLDS